jgi:hypothetical protein
MQHSKRGLAGVYKIMENRQRRREQWRADAKALWEQWRHDPFFILGVALYWGEGTKSKTAPCLALTNSDATMLQVWLCWCQRFLPNIRLNYSLVIHDSCDLDAARRFWKTHLGIDVRVISVAVSAASKRKRNSLPHGTLKVRVGRGSVEWYTKMLVWLELAPRLSAATPV